MDMPSIGDLNSCIVNDHPVHQHESVSPCQWMSWAKDSQIAVMGQQGPTTLLIDALCHAYQFTRRRNIPDQGHILVYLPPFRLPPRL
jgi:hypothetical protein